MAEHIAMKQVPNGTVTATDDRILYDYMVNSGIIYGCECSYLGNNMIHINAGYGIIKGGLFEMEDHVEYVDYAEVTSTTGQIYLHFDAAAEDKLTIVKETSANLHPMITDEDANYDSGVYEIQLCTFVATTTALANFKQTFKQATMPIDVLDSIEAIRANTDSNKAAGALAVKEALGGLRFGINGDGDGGYYKADGSFVPFKNATIVKLGVGRSFNVKSLLGLTNAQASKLTSNNFFLEIPSTSARADVYNVDSSHVFATAYFTAFTKSYSNGVFSVGGGTVMADQSYNPNQWPYKRATKEINPTVYVVLE